MLAERLIAGPAAEPVTLDEVREHLRLSGIEQDALLTRLIATQRTALEHDYGRAFVTQTRELRLDQFPCGAVRLPRAPLQSIASVKYVDDAGALQTWDAANYQVDTFREPGLVFPAYGLAWPTTRAEPGAVRIQYVAGYGDDSTFVPEPVRQALLVRLEDAFVSDAVRTKVDTVGHLMAPYTVLWTP